ncbi:MAG TPA: HNH endonuclease [Pseudobacteroides sp.]|nr:HNH endonuclease [Pseudobacteroides sp.]
MEEEKFDFQYSINIDTDQWLEILRDTDLLSKFEFSFLEAVYLSDGHRNRAKHVAHLMGLPDYRILNRSLGSIAKKIKKKFDYQIVCDKNDSTKLAWCVPFYANRSGNGFTWVMRPELVQAFNEIYFDNRHLKQIEYSRDDLLEGQALNVMVTRYERNPTARRMCLEFYGYTCVVCGFNFESKYGEVGRGKIHVHHLIQISERKKVYSANPVKDLRPVCPNCHLIIHSKTPPYSIEEVKEMIESKLEEGGNIS